MLAPTAQVLAQETSKAPVSPYYVFIVASCPGKNLEVTLNTGQKVSGRCQAPQPNHFQLTHKGVTHDIPYTSISKINIRRSWFGKVKHAVSVPYLFFKLAIGAEDLIPLQ